ncbi:flagellar motor protein MotB [Planctomicrobium sp. SH664]|uniref:flagellar motor protein MotB n=1 Tax=Planctomicrobium sp. SH664 TaxID=3448125 RepID=UPI003F5CB4E7
MAGKGGGAWKVAYADFVTAMMAFFLVMWLISQDQKVKESIAHYFAGPVGINLLGDSTRAPNSGGLFYSHVEGPVPGKTTRTAGRSIGMNPEPTDEESETMVLAEWLETDPQLNQRWLKQTRHLLEQASQHDAVRDGTKTADDMVRAELARQLRAEFSSGAIQQSQGLYRDVLLTTFAKLDWLSIADELLLNCHEQ